jgi:hypothetical protein
MSRPSSVDQLPEEVRAKIGQLRQLGWTIDQILEHLSGLVDRAPSRSALGRHIKGLDALGERMRRSRHVAEALVRELGDAPESRTARLNIELLHSAVLDLFMRAADGEDGSDAEGVAALAGNPEGTMMLAKALDHLSRASKTNVDFVMAAEKRATERAKKEAAVAVETVAKERGISGDTLEAIKAGIFGVKVSTPGDGARP